MLLQSLKLTNVLSFGPDAKVVALRPLNVLIGPNGSGKSNFLEAIGLLRAAPRELVVPVREGGGVGEWIWKGHGQGPGARRVHEGTGYGGGSADGSGSGVGTGYGGGSADGSGFGDGTGYGGRVATVEVLLSFRSNKDLNLRHRISFSAVGQRFELVDERIESEKPAAGKRKLYLYLGYERGRPMLNVKDGKGERALKRENLHPERSILAQFKDPDKYAELAFASKAYDDIALYREWSFGRGSPPRMPQKSDLPTDHLLEDSRNLGLILNRYRIEPSTKRSLIEAMRQVFDGIVDFSVKIEGGTVRVFLEEERGWSTPATRLSDGTVRWLSR
jgi:predicted ATPase